MRIVSRRSTDISGRSSRRWWSVISTAGILSADLPGFGVQTVERSASASYCPPRTPDGSRRDRRVFLKLDWKGFLTEWRVESILLLTVLLSLLLCLYFLAIDLAILSMILLFQDISRRKSRKIVKFLRVREIEFPMFLRPVEP